MSNILKVLNTLVYNIHRIANNQPVENCEYDWAVVQVFSFVHVRCVDFGNSNIKILNYL